MSQHITKNKYSFIYCFTVRLNQNILVILAFLFTKTLTKTQEEHQNHSIYAINTITDATIL